MYKKEKKKITLYDYACHSVKTCQLIHDFNIVCYNL